MDRRRLIVGSGAAAVATTLGALAGTTVSAQAAPARTSLRPLTTADHARLVLDEVNIDLGLVNPAGLQRRYEECYAAVRVLPPREPNPGDLETWIQRRMVELCGTDDYAEAVAKIPQTRSLLAFNFLAYSQNQDKPLPRLDPGMRIPLVFERLEPDFLPVLLDLIAQKSRESRGFAAALGATSAQLDRIIAEKVKESSSAAKSGRVQTQAAPGQPSAGDGVALAAGVLIIMAFVYWVKRELKL